MYRVFLKIFLGIFTLFLLTLYVVICVYIQLQIKLIIHGIKKVSKITEMEENTNIKAKIMVYKPKFPSEFLSLLLCLLLLKATTAKVIYTGIFTANAKITDVIATPKP